MIRQHDLAILPRLARAGTHALQSGITNSCGQGTSLHERGIIICKVVEEKHGGLRSLVSGQGLEIIDQKYTGWGSWVLPGARRDKTAMSGAQLSMNQVAR